MRPLGVTPEMRQAVYAADCLEHGHLLDPKVGYGPGNDLDVLSGRDADELPHVRCRRCSKVWVILADDPADGYEAAEEKVTKRVKKGDRMADLVVEKRARRQRKREIEKRREEA